MTETEPKTHPYSHVLIGIAEGKTIEVLNENYGWEFADSTSVLSYIVAGLMLKRCLQPHQMRVLSEDHPHIEFIKAYAKGTEVEYFNVYKEWVSLKTKEPRWSTSVQYRIKPTELLKEVK